jgi:hypothetical protein
MGLSKVPGQVGSQVRETKKRRSGPGLTGHDRSTSRPDFFLYVTAQERQELWLPKDDLRDSSSWSSPPLVLLRDIHSKLLPQYNCREEVCEKSQSQVNVGSGDGPSSQSGAGPRPSSQDGVRDLKLMFAPPQTRPFRGCSRDAFVPS